MANSFEFYQVYNNKLNMFNLLNINSFSLVFWYDDIIDGIKVKAGPKMTKKDGPLGIGNNICILLKSTSRKDIIYVSVDGKERQDKNVYSLSTNTIILADETNPGIITSNGILRWNIQRTYFILPKREYSWSENAIWATKSMAAGIVSMVAAVTIMPYIAIPGILSLTGFSLYHQNKNTKINFNTARYLHFNHLDSNSINSWPIYIRVMSKDLIKLIDECREKFDETKCEKIRDRLSYSEDSGCNNCTKSTEGKIVPWTRDCKDLNTNLDSDCITSIDIDIYNKWFKYYSEPSNDYQHRDPNFKKKGYQGFHTILHIIKHTGSKTNGSELIDYKFYNNIPFFVQQAIMNNPNAFNHAHEDLQKDIGMICFALKHGYEYIDLLDVNMPSSQIIRDINNNILKENADKELYNFLYFWAVSNPNTVVDNWKYIDSTSKQNKNIIIMAILSGLINDKVQSNFDNYNIFDWEIKKDNDNILNVINEALLDFGVLQILCKDPEILEYCKLSINFHRDPKKYKVYKDVIENPHLFKFNQNYLKSYQLGWFS